METERENSRAPSPGEAHEQGCWGEEMAAAHLRRLGWRIVERNAHPCRGDMRCELDIIAYVPAENRVVFVEVKTHRVRSPRATRLWCIDRRKKSILLRACSNWILREKWHGNFRFDVVQVYGTPEAPNPPEIDHIENVPLFPPKWRFW